MSFFCENNVKILLILMESLHIDLCMLIFYSSSWHVSHQLLLLISKTQALTDVCQFR